MRVLIATNDHQNPASGDYSFTVEGELVTPLVAECCSPDRCGCGRGFPGLASSKATTTAMVVDRPFITIDDLRDAVRDWLERSGWADLFREQAVDDDAADRLVDEIVDEHVEAITEVCDTYPVDSVVQRHGDIVSLRSFRSAA